MGTYTLSAIVTKVTGQTVLDYLKPRLFEPLGIETLRWDKSPEGNSLGVAVALGPVAAHFGVGFLVVGDLLAGGHLDPLFGNDLLAVPFALLEVELAELGDVLGLEEQPVVVTSQEIVTS
jgi:hypothetical protein